jgi:hypothetical protein
VLSAIGGIAVGDASTCMRSWVWPTIQPRAGIFSKERFVRRSRLAGPYTGNHADRANVEGSSYLGALNGKVAASAYRSLFVR